VEAEKEIPSFFLNKDADDVISGLNKRRKSKKLKPFSSEEALTNAACTLGEGMYVHEYLFSMLPNGDDWRNILPRKIKDCAIYIAFGYDHEKPTAERLLNTIMASQTGNDLSMNSYQNIGVGLYAAEDEGDWLWFCIIIYANIPEEN
jgi:hypothetical protein